MTMRRGESSGLERRACRARSILRIMLLGSAIALSGCAGLNPVRWVAHRSNPEVTTAMTPHTVADASRASVVYERDPHNARAAIAYARALRELGSNQAAANV